MHISVVDAVRPNPETKALASPLTSPPSKILSPIPPTKLEAGGARINTDNLIGYSNYVCIFYYTASF